LQGFVPESENEMTHGGGVTDGEMRRRLERAIASDEVGQLRDHLVAHSRLPGPRMNLQLVDELAAAAAELVQRSPSSGDALAAVLDGWAALSPDDAPGDRPEVILPCAAVLGYGAVAAVRPEWWDHELAKVRRAAGDSRWRVREMVAAALQRILAADWSRAVATLRDWAGAGDPLLVRAAAAAVAEPSLLGDADHGADAIDVQRRAVEALRSVPAAERRSENVRVLRQGLAYTVSVAVAATGDFGPLDAMASSGDPDLTWAVKKNLEKSRLRPWPQGLARVRALLD
jgi:hypothetical protein